MRDDGQRRYPDLPRNTARVRSDVDDEIAFELDMRVRELVAQGMTPDAARDRARREFGDIETTRAYCLDLDATAERSRRRTAWLEELREDTLFAVRGMRRVPSFALVVLLTLAVGIGANTAIFSVVRRMLIDRLPYRDGGQVVRIYGGPSGSGFLSARELVDLGTSPSLSGVAAFGWIGGSTYYGEESAEMWASAAVTTNFFAVLGARPALGRAIGDADTVAGAAPVAMISHAIWQRVFGGDSSVVGRQIRLGPSSSTVIGVMPADFVSPTFTADLWWPLTLRSFLADPSGSRNKLFRGVGRLAPGATIERATADAATLAARWNAEVGGQRATPPPRIVALRDAMVGSVRGELLAVMGAALLVLLITCANVAGLFLARGTARRREIAVRAALGGGRGRLIRQLLTESALYGLAGGVLGIALAFMVRGPLAAVAATSLPNLGPIGIDASMLATAAAMSILSGLAFGLLPAFSATRVDMKESLGESSRGASAGGPRTRARQALVTAQVALAVMLMIGAGLLVRSFASLVRTDLGYSADERVLTFRLSAPPTDPRGQQARNAFIDDVLARVRGVPGVMSVGTTAIGPWNGPSAVRPRTVGGDSAGAPTALYMTANEDYFSAIGTRLIRGRAIAATDRPGAPVVAVLSEALARTLFPTGDALGSRVVFESPAFGRRDVVHEVVGIVQDVRQNVMNEAAPAVYVSDWQQNGSRGPELLVRTRGDASLLIPSIRRAIREVSPGALIVMPRTMREVARRFIAPQELSMALFAGFAALALSLAALGVYAVMAYVVAARTREFGIRAALGARRGSLLLLVLRQGMTSTIVGCVVGLFVAAAGARLIERLLSGVSTHDALTFIVAPILLVAIALMACLIPARTATKVQPVEALRME